MIGLAVLRGSGELNTNSSLPNPLEATWIFPGPLFLAMSIIMHMLPFLVNVVSAAELGTS